MKIRMTSLGLPAAFLAAALFGACSNTARGVKEDTAQNTEKAGEAAADAKVKSEAAAERASDATRDAAHDAAVATKGASEEAERKSKEAANSAAASIDAGQQTLDIKSALVADKSVDASGIDVDTNGATKTVTLKGHVPNAAQKATAERIARSKAPGYAVVNDLLIK